MIEVLVLCFALRGPWPPHRRCRAHGAAANDNGGKQSKRDEEPCKERPTRFHQRAAIEVLPTSAVIDQMRLAARRAIKARRRAPSGKTEQGRHPRKGAVMRGQDLVTRCEQPPIDGEEGGRPGRRLPTLNSHHV